MKLCVLTTRSRTDAQRARLNASVMSNKIVKGILVVMLGLLLGGLLNFAIAISGYVLGWLGASIVIAILCVYPPYLISKKYLIVWPACMTMAILLLSSGVDEIMRRMDYLYGSALLVSAIVVGVSSYLGTRSNMRVVTT